MAANGPLAAAALDFDDSSIICSIPQHHEPQCCCGSITCAFLQETRAAFDRLDESLHTAGRLGQALLVRHEAYVAESESERKHLREDIDRLAQDRDALQDQNTQVIDENRQLLQDLELANNAVAEADSHVTSLTATLKSTQDEIQRLNVLARRTQALEKEIEQFEQDQARLHASLITKTEEERTATLRWQESERALASIQDRIETIEEDAKVEREQHVEIISRLERRRLVEKELDAAAGRLKGAAANKSGKDAAGSNGVVSHFVKDILQDNANLQLSVVELRDLLSNANEQVEKLREQLDEHLIAEPDSHRLQESTSFDRSDPVISRRTSAHEVHVHHHYHGPKPETTRRQSQILRKPKKRRQGISFGLPSHHSHRAPSLSFIPTEDTSSTPGSSVAAFGSSPPSSYLQSSARSVSNATIVSTIPSSPRSHSSPIVTDRVFSDVDLDSSRPTTPGTEMCDSPRFAAMSKRRESESFFQPLDATVLHSDDIVVPSSSPPPSEKPLSRSDSAQSVLRLDDDEVDPEHSLVDFSRTVSSLEPFIPRLRPIRSMTDEDIIAASSTGPSQLRAHQRSNSHESLLSVSGMDIHTLRSRPSQMLTGQSTRSFSSEATVTATTAQAARPILSTASSSPSTSSPGLGQRVSGWVFSKWGNNSGTSSVSPLNPGRNNNSNAAAAAVVALQEETTTGGKYDDGQGDDASDCSDEERSISDDEEFSDREGPYQSDHDEGDGTIGADDFAAEDEPDDDDHLFEGASYAHPRPGGTEEELERMLKRMSADDPRRRSIEREYARLMRDLDWRFGVGGPFG